MRLHIQYVDRQGAILVREEVNYMQGHASEQQLQDVAKLHLETLNLSQRCVAAIVAANIYTLVTTAVWS